MTERPIWDELAARQARQRQFKEETKLMLFGCPAKLVVSVDGVVIDVSEDIRIVHGRVSLDGSSVQGKIEAERERWRKEQREALPWYAKEGR